MFTPTYDPTAYRTGDEHLYGSPYYEDDNIAPDEMGDEYDYDPDLEDMLAQTIKTD